jgi:ribose transport system substrate-binding protein
MTPSKNNHLTRRSRDMRMRKGIALLATAALAAGVAACGDDDEGGGGGGGSSSSENYNMTLLAGVKGDEFYITMNCGAQEEASK